MGRRCEIVLDRVSTAARGHASALDLLLLSKNGRQPTNLGAKRGADMLRLIGDQLLYAGHNLMEEGLALEQCTESCRI
jgi:hypothetical protein